jgi:cytochrome c553
MIAGQSAGYIEAALRAYQKGERSHPSMTAVARGLSDTQITSLAAYYASRGTHPTENPK